MSEFLTMNDFNFKNKVVLVRVDFNSPLDPKTKKILDDTRIRTHAETLKELSDKCAKTVVMAHQGRPGDPDFSTLEQHAKILGKILGKTVKYVDDIFEEKAKNAIKKLNPGEILVLENVRTFPGETEKKSPEEHAKSDLVKNLAPLANIYINDAFAASHRAHASLVGFTTELPTAAGRVMEKELKTLGRVTKATEKPCIYVLGGAKAEDSAKISQYVLGYNIADYVITGGVVANLFLQARGHNLGEPNRRYLEEKGFTELIPQIKDLFKKYNGKILLPEDLAIEVEGKRREITLADLPTLHPIYDIGPKTIQRYANLVKKAKIVVLNGPMGVYEKDEFINGTKGVFEAVAKSKAFSVVGGGHTVAAVEKLGLADKMSYISTGGGALVEFLTGEKLPAVEALEKAALKSRRK